MSVASETRTTPSNMLRPLRQRPGRGRGAEEGEDGAAVHCIASTHSITSSARTSSAVGMVSPSALAVFRLMISSIFVAC